MVCEAAGDGRLLRKTYPLTQFLPHTHFAPYIGNDGSGPNVIMCVGLAF